MPLGLPDGIRAVLFDMDGVLTQTAKLHAAAWKEMFDAYLRERAGAGDSEPFDADADYDRYVDGRPRVDGVRTFLASRGIELPEAEVSALGDRKNDAVQRLIAERGVEAFPTSIAYAKAARATGLRSGVVSSSANTKEVLKAAGIDDLFDVIVDGHDLEARGLKGKPAPDTFLAAAEDLGVQPREAAVFEDALAGVEAGRAGAFGCVVGVDRTGQAEALRQRGADIVVRDLAELLGRK
jgi:beta-phosphoglucomutase family hydrolase